MSDIPTILQHQPYPCPGGTCSPPQVQPCPPPNGQTALTGTNYAGDPCFVRDYIRTANSIDLRVHQYTIYVTYGITRHLDFSAAIPFLDVRMSVSSAATIVPNSAAPAALGVPGNVWHQFNFNSTIPALQSQCPAGRPVRACKPRFPTLAALLGSAMSCFVENTPCTSGNEPALPWGWTYACPAEMKQTSWARVPWA